MNTRVARRTDQVIGSSSGNDANTLVSESQYRILKGRRISKGSSQRLLAEAVGLWHRKTCKLEAFIANYEIEVAEDCASTRFSPIQ